MTDFLTEKRAEIAQRLEELRPLREEYVRLERAKAALEGAGAQGAEARTAGPSHRLTRGDGARARGGASSNGRRRRRAGGRAAEALELVRQNPGITISEMGERLGMRQHNYLYRIVAGLESDGAVEKQGRGFVAR